MTPGCLSEPPVEETIWPITEVNSAQSAFFGRVYQIPTSATPAFTINVEIASY